MSAYLSLIGWRRGWRLFKAERLLTFSAFRMGAYSRWALIRGWALIPINTVSIYLSIYLSRNAYNDRLRAGRHTHATNTQEYPLGRKVNDFIVNEAYRDGGL